MGKNVLYLLILGSLLLPNINLSAQGEMIDVVKLKNNKGILKGLITQQTPTGQIVINPFEATLVIEQSRIRQVIKSNGSGEDKLLLVNGETINGKIIESYPENWYKIEVSDISPQHYSLKDVECISKMTKNEDDDIFKAYGLTDVITFKNGTTVSGIIIEQHFLNKEIRVFTKELSTVVFPLDLVSYIEKKPSADGKDMFETSAFIDVVNLKNDGSVIKGIIVKQIPGKNITIEVPTNIGNSKLVQPLIDILSIGKEVNSNRIIAEQNAKAQKKLDTITVGTCWQLQNDCLISVPRFGWIQTNEKDVINYSIQVGETQILNFKPKSKIELIVKLNDTINDPNEQIFIFPIINKKGEYLVNANIRNRFLMDDKNAICSSCVDFEIVKYSGLLYKIIFKVEEQRYYGIFVKNSGKFITLINFCQAGATIKQ